ncbi:MAG: hypothetical protein WCP55_03025 [Lentisphaerota bacterium]
MKKELLIKLRDCLIELEYNSFTGLCFIVNNELKDVTDKEQYQLLKYIRDHRPKSGKHFDPEYNKDGWYFWPIGENTPVSIG